MELPQSPTAPRPTLTLRDLAAKYHGSDKHQARQLVVYFWNASADWDPPVQQVFVEELQSLDAQCWDRRISSGTMPISVVAVYAGSEDARGRVYGLIQEAARGNQRIPTYVDVGLGFAEAAAHELDLKQTFVPGLLVMDAVTLAITASRSDDPVRADAWVALLESAYQGAVHDDPDDLPKGSERSWLRRHVARAVRGGISGLVGGPEFRPKDPATDVEFIEWLGQTSPHRAEGALREYDPDHPQVLSRERAITATVRFLYGDDPIGALDSCPQPVGEITQGRGAETATLWRRAFSTVPGSAHVDASLRPYLTLALARGLLYQEPSLHAQWPLTREAAAWFLAHALASVADGPTGVVVDCVDVPLMPDRRFGRGEIHVETEDGKQSRVYPSGAVADRLPLPQVSYPSVLYVEKSRIDDGTGRHGEWLMQRVGPRPLVVRPMRVVGQGSLGSRVVIAAGDGEKIRALNRERGVLDDWRVAFVTGVGAQLVSATKVPLPRREAVAVQFSVEMDATTIGPDTIWLQRRGMPDRVACRYTVKAGGPSLVYVQPEAPLDPGATYDVMLGLALRSARGDPLLLREGAQLPSDVARQWTITTENTVSAYLYITEAPEGSEVYIEGRHRGTTPLASPISFEVTPGPLAVQLRMPDGRALTKICEVNDDGAVVVKVDPPKPKRLIVQGAPSTLGVGEAAEITLEAVDEEGRRISDHAPLRVTLAVAGGEVLPGLSLGVTAGRAAFTLWSERLGKVSVKLTADDPGIEVIPDAIEVLCKHVEVSYPTLWSQVERWELPPARPDASDLHIGTQLRRWFALDLTHEVRVVSREGLAFTRVEQLPGRNEFSVDASGFLHFHRAAARSVVDICYEYERHRCGLLVGGPPGGDGVTVAVEEIMRDLLEELGYVCVPTAELAAVLSPQERLPSGLSASQAELALDALSLTELFVVDLSSTDASHLSGTIDVWSKEGGNVRRASYPSTGTEMRIRVDRRRRPPIDPRRSRAAVQTCLQRWFDRIGLLPKPLGR